MKTIKQIKEYFKSAHTIISVDTGVEYLYKEEQVFEKEGWFYMRSGMSVVKLWTYFSGFALYLNK